MDQQLEEGDDESVGEVSSASWAATVPLGEVYAKLECFMAFTFA